MERDVDRRVGRIRDHGLRAQSHRASAINRVVAAVVLWNTTYLQAAIDHLASLGRSIPDEYLPHLSPLGWQRINITGDYLWAAPEPRHGRLRPFRPAPDLRIRDGALAYICARSMCPPNSRSSILGKEIDVSPCGALDRCTATLDNLTSDIETVHAIDAQGF